MVQFPKRKFAKSSRVVGILLRDSFDKGSPAHLTKAPAMPSTPFNGSSLIGDRLAMLETNPCQTTKERASPPKALVPSSIIALYPSIKVFSSIFPCCCSSKSLNS